MVNVQFDEQGGQSFEFHNTPKGMTGWVINNSGGTVQKEGSAAMLLLVAAIGGFVVSAFLVLKIISSPQLSRPEIDLNGQVIVPGRRPGTL